jgi:two-component system, OmpR family, sensor kinase
VTGSRGGIGVGLAIVRWVAELHGGRAYVAPADGPGALVKLELPRFIVR